MKLINKSIFIILFIATINIAQDNGFFDNSFNYGNTLYLYVPNPDEKFGDITVQPDNKIIAVGYSQGLLGEKIDYSYTAFRIKEDGAIDSTFGENGLVLFGSGRATAVEVLKDGKILVVGNMSEGVGLARLNTDGSLDSGFGTEGITIIPMSTVFKQGVVYDMKLLSTGKILLTGYLADGVNNVVLVICVNQDGSIDTSFGSNGYIEVDLLSTTDQGDYILEQDDSKILILCQSGYYFVAVRFNPDGTIDESYGDNGRAAADLRVSQTSGDRFKGRLQDDGKLVVAGYAPDPNKSNRNNFSAVRITNNGTIDSTFGTGGYVNVDFDESQNQDWAYDVLIAEQGKILLGGSYTDSNNFTNLGILALNSDGSIDESFGVNGRASALGYAIRAMQFDGSMKIVTGGYSTQDKGYAVARFTYSENTTAVNHVKETVLDEYVLSQNYPNPFNPATKINFSIPSSEYVSLRVYDVLGNEVAELINKNLSPGNYSVDFNVSNLPAGRQALSSGIYFYRLSAGSYLQTRKMILLK